jgi:RNA polymerase sigma-70 factor (ECF subfamily)
MEDAEDVAQETFLKLFRTGTWKQMRDEKRFLARTAWRLAVDRVLAKHFFSHC